MYSFSIKLFWFYDGSVDVYGWMFHFSLVEKGGCWVQRSVVLFLWELEQRCRYLIVCRCFCWCVMV